MDAEAGATSMLTLCVAGGVTRAGEVSAGRARRAGWDGLDCAVAAAGAIANVRSAARIARAAGGARSTISIP
jgi:hypothetical protein